MHNYCYHLRCLLPKEGAPILHRASAGQLNPLTPTTVFLRTKLTSTVLVLTDFKAESMAVARGHPESCGTDIMLANVVQSNSVE